MHAGNLRVWRFLEDFRNQMISPTGPRPSWTLEEIEDLFEPEDWKDFGVWIYKTTSTGMRGEPPKNWEDHGRIAFAHRAIEIGKLQPLTQPRPPKIKKDVRSKVIAFPVRAGRAPDAVSKAQFVDQEPSTCAMLEMADYRNKPKSTDYPEESPQERAIRNYFRDRCAEAEAARDD